MKEKQRKKRSPLKRVFTGALVFLLIFSALSFGLVAAAHLWTFKRWDPAGTDSHPSIDYYPELQREKVILKSGKNELCCWFYPAPEAKGIAVLAHGLYSCADDYLYITARFAEEGYAVFAMNNTGSCESGGKSLRGLPQAVIDLDIALKYLEDREDTRALPFMLFGHSWGGYAVCAVMNYDHPNVKAVASVAGFNSSAEASLETVRGYIGPLVYAEYPYFQAYSRLLFGNAAFFTAADGINKSGADFLIMHGDADATLDIERNSVVSHKGEITNPNARYIIAEGGTHTSLLSGRLFSNILELFNKFAAE